jgi:hypothetical protein
VLLVLGTNTQPSEPKLTNTHNGNLHGLLPVLHRSDRWLGPVRPVDRAGQVGGYSSRTTTVPGSHSDFSRPWNKTPPKHNLQRIRTLLKPSKITPNLPRTDQKQHNQKTHGSSKSPETSPTRGLHRSDRSRAPVRPVTPGQLGMNNTRGSTPSNPTPDLLIRSTNSHKTLGIVGTPHGHSLAKLWSNKTRLIKRNQRISAKNTTNPRTTKTPKSIPYGHGFGRGIKGKRATKGSSIYPPPNPQEKGLENAPRKLSRNGSENHQKERTRTTHPSLEEPRRIIYTYQGGSYKV